LHARCPPHSGPGDTAALVRRHPGFSFVRPAAGELHSWRVADSAGRAIRRICRKRRPDGGGGRGPSDAASTGQQIRHTCIPEFEMRRRWADPASEKGHGDAVLKETHYHHSHGREPLRIDGSPRRFEFACSQFGLTPGRPVAEPSDIPCPVRPPSHACTPEHMPQALTPLASGGRSPLGWVRM